MPHIPIMLRSFLLVLALLLAAGTARADSGKDLFEKQCAGCHTIGGGDGAGPDLKGVAGKRPAEWLVRVIAEPDKLTAEKDATQAELVKRYGMEMPNLGVSREDAKKIAAFLGGGSAPAKGPAAAAPAGANGSTATAAAPETGATGADATAAAQPPADPAAAKELLAAGRDLFTGKARLARGGAPCVSCHALSYPGVHGGALAADLTGLYRRMGENGVRGVLKSLSFPVMKKAYADRPLTDEEIAALTAFFKEASAAPAAQGDPYPLAGLGFFALCLAGAILFKRRIG